MPRITPYLLYEDCAAMLEWLGRAFGFREVLRYADDDGTVTHAEMDFQGGTIMMGDPGPEYRSPRRLGARTAQVFVLVDDVDAHCERARAAGAEVTRGPQDEPYGFRRYTALDPEGQMWDVGQPIREVAPEEWGAVGAGG